MKAYLNTCKKTIPSTIILLSTHLDLTMIFKTNSELLLQYCIGYSFLLLNCLKGLVIVRPAFLQRSVPVALDTGVNSVTSIQVTKDCQLFRYLFVYSTTIEQLSAVFPRASSSGGGNSRQSRHAPRSVWGQLITTGSYAKRA